MYYSSPTFGHPCFFDSVINPCQSHPTLHTESKCYHQAELLKVAHTLRTDKASHRIEVITLQFDAWITPNDSEKVAESRQNHSESFTDAIRNARHPKKPSHRNETTYIISVHIGSVIYCLPNPRLDNVQHHSRWLLIGDSPKTTVNLTGNQIFDTELHRFSATTKERLTSDRFKQRHLRQADSVFHPKSECHHKPKTSEALRMLYSTDTHRQATNHLPPNQWIRICWLEAQAKADNKTDRSPVAEATEPVRHIQWTEKFY